jgi:anion-transporting  ArsA/GET3 family ATPase
MAILQESIIKWIAPSNGGFSAARAGALLFGRGQQAMFSMFERFVGSDVLSGISEFIGSFSGLIGGMRARAAQVMTLLRSEQTAFVLVASPSRVALSEALYFHDRLHDSGIDVCALVVNRVRSELLSPGEQPRETAWEAGFIPSDGAGRDALVDSIWERYLDTQEQCRIDDRNIAILHGHCGLQLPLIRIPRLDREVHDLSALSELAELLSRS